MIAKRFATTHGTESKGVVVCEMFGAVQNIKREREEVATQESYMMLDAVWFKKDGCHSELLLHARAWPRKIKWRNITCTSSLLCKLGLITYSSTISSPCQSLERNCKSYQLMVSRSEGGKGKGGKMTRSNPNTSRNMQVYKVVSLNS